MYDEKLVRAAQDGDEAAFAAVYDRYSDAVHDLCWSLIGDAAEAARFVEDTFVLAARHLDELSDATQVRAWLLAIARDRIVTEDEQGTLRSGWATGHPGGGDAADPEEPLGTVALRSWTAGAAAVLALTDQAVLELQLRHQLEDYQLAAAIGCPVEALASITERVRAEAEHVLGALIVARQARRDCPELDAALAGWDAVPTAEVADLVDAHTGSCDRCSRRRALVNPLELIAAAPVVAAPTTLRNQVLDLSAVELAAHRSAGAPATGLVSAVAAPGAAGATEDGVVPVATEAARRRPIAPLFAVAAAAIVLAGALTMVLRSPSHPQSAAAVRPGIVSIVPGPTTSSSPSTTVVSSLASLDTTTSSSTSLLPTGRLELNASRVDFGADATTAQITLRNSGTGGVDWSGSSTATWLSIAPTAGHLESNGAVSVTLVLDRRLAPRGPFEVRVAFQPTDQSQTSTSLLAVGSASGPPTSSTSTSTTSSTTVPGGPTITDVTASPSTIFAAPCTPDTSSVSATVTDQAALSSVVMTFTLADGRHGTTPLSQSGNSTWTGTLGPSTRAGTDIFQVVATDAAGSSRTSDSISVTVSACH